MPRKKENEISEKNPKLAEFSLDHASDSILWMGQNAKFLFANQSACKRLNYSKKELLSMTVHDIDPNFPANKWPSHWKELKKKKTLLFESIHKTKDGEIIPVEITANYLEFNKKEYNFAFVRDITERKKTEAALRESEEKFRAITSTAKDAIVLADSSDKIAFWNKAAEEMFGYHAKEVLGEKLHETIAADIDFHEKNKQFKHFGETGESKVLGKTLELTVKRKDNSTRLIELSVSRVNIKNRWYALGIMRDITERKKAEEKLRESEERWHSLIEYQPTGNVIHSNLEILYVNSACVEMGGAKNKEEIIGRNALDFVHPDYHEKVVNRIKEVIEKAVRPTASEEIFLKTNGEPFPVEAIALPINYMGKKAVQTVFWDITERKKAQEALKESEEKFRKLVGSTADVIWQTDENSKIIYVSPTVKSLMGFEPKEVLGRTPISFIVPDKQKEAEKVIEREIAEKGRLSAYESTLLCKDKSQKIFETSLTPMTNREGRLKGFFGVCKDITERKKAQEALKESEERYRNIFENSLVGIYLSTEEGRFLSANSALATILGYDSPEDMIKNMSDMGTEVYADPVFRKNKIRELIENGGGSYILPAKRKDGKKIWLMNYVKTLIDPAKKTHLFNGVLFDITEKMEADKALKASEERYRTLVDTQIESICRWLPDTTLTYANEEYCKSLGKTGEEIIGKKWVELIPEDARKKANEFYRKLAKNPRIHRYEHRIKKTNGDLIWEEWIDSPIFNDKGRLAEFQSVGRDITERKNAEENIKNALREKELLLKEIHHRVKNNLQIISSLLNIQKEKLKDEDDIQVFSDSQNYIKSLALVHEKLYNTKDLSKINFKEYTSSLAKHLMRSYGKAGSVAVKVEGNKILLDVDKAATCGIIINELLTNSIKHAFRKEEGGTIKIKLDKRNSEAVVSISDDGSGMPEDFDIESSGSLGLSLVHNMVKQLQGEIKIIRKNGTSFIISFKTDNN